MINLIYTILSILCLCTGFYFGYKLGKTKELPEVTVNPVKIAEKVENDIKEYKTHKENNKKDKKQQENINILNDIIGNINVYDGTGANQKVIKK